MPKPDVHPWIEELADETRKGGVNRRDFLRYASVMGVSLFAAGAMAGMKPREVLAMEQENWAALNKESPFEVKNLLIERAQEACAKQSKAGRSCSVLNAGRGNPDFLNVTVRQAFALLLSFAAYEAGHLAEDPDLGMIAPKAGMAAKLRDFAKQHAKTPGGEMLAQSVEYILTKLGMDPDEAAYQLVDAVQGDHYPEPSMIQPVVEKGVAKYLEKIVFSGRPPKKPFGLFATEGATAAMVYLFKSLQVNKILTPGDKIAIVTPIFSPYLEIPVLARFGLKPVYIATTAKEGWQIPPSELNKLKDRSVKGLFLVNPANPASVSLNAATVQKIAKIVRNDNPDLVVISDTVYASFVDEFHTLAEEIPENVLGAYSFSKYFGVTGWRLGVIMAVQNNVVDRLIARLPKREQAMLDARYRLTSTQPETIPFLERLEIDSRDVALAHTGGLSTPQQVIMLLFSVFELLDEKCEYKKAVMNVLRERWAGLYKGLELPAPDDPGLTRYYALIDLQDMARRRHGEAGVKALSGRQPLELLFKLAEDAMTVCLPGAGFAGPEWSLRVALANLNAKDCEQVGVNIKKTLDAFVGNAKS
jgi:aspartate 4-decarboxylase